MLTINRGGATSKLQYFLIASTCLLYLVAAGLFSRGVWFIEAQAWNDAIGGDAAETGSGPGSYDIENSVWHINVSKLEYPTRPVHHTLTPSSTVTQNLMEVVGGVSSIPYLAGKTPQLTAPLSHIIAIGSP